MKLDGIKVVVTGTFANYPAEELVDELASRGAVVVDRVTPDVQTVFAGTNPDRLIDDAMALGIRVRDEEELRAALEGREPPRRVVDAPIVPPDEPDYESYGQIAEGETGRASSPMAQKTSPMGQKTSPMGQVTSSERVFERGARVKIVGGREGVGKVGEIFWWGESKFGDGMRAGVTGDDDIKYWVDEADLGWPEDELSPEAIETVKASKGLGKGVDVRVIAGKSEGETGTIFWWGPSKWGEGMRAGVETHSGEKVWVDAAELEALETDDTPEDDDIPF